MVVVCLMALMLLLIGCASLMAVRAPKVNVPDWEWFGEPLPPESLEVLDLRDAIREAAK